MTSDEQPNDEMRETAPNQRTLERWGWASISVNLGLASLNFAIAYASDSLAVAAEMVHNAADLFASVAVLVGLKLSKQRSRKFPYGLYKVENLVAAGISILIFLTAYEMAKDALLSEPKEIAVSPLILGGVVLSMLTPYIFSLFEMRVGKRANSPSLVADAKEFRTHVLTSGVVLISLIAHSTNLPVDQIAAAVVILVIVKTGWSLLLDSMRVLLDASLKPETLELARDIIEQAPMVINVQSVIGRNAGRYFFLEADVEVRARDLKQIALVIQRLEQAIREEMPHVEKVLINAMPKKSDTIRLALPLNAPGGEQSEHFGAASYFLILEKRRIDGETLRDTTMSNPFADHPRGRGIKVAHWLVERDIDVLLTSDDITDKGPGHVLGEAGIDVRICQQADVSEALESFVNSLSQRADE